MCLVLHYRQQHTDIRGYWHQLKYALCCLESVYSLAKVYNQCLEKQIAPELHQVLHLHFQSGNAPSSVHGSLMCYLLCQDSLVVRAPDSWLKGHEFESRQEWQENFLLQSQLYVLTRFQCPFHPHVTAVAHKSPLSFCQKCRWQVTPKQAYTFDPMKSEWADYAAVQAYFGNQSGNELTRNSSGNTWSRSSQLAEPLWTDSGIRVELVCAS